MDMESKAKKIVQDGLREEEDFVRLANLDISLENKIWKFFIDKKIISENEIDKICMVRCTQKQYSKIAKQKTLTKSDAFIAYGEKIQDKLAKSSYLIRSDDMQSLNLRYKPNSGISIKKEASKIQIQKFTVDSFEEFMNMGKEARYLGAGVSLYVMKPEEIEKNISKVFPNWKVDTRDMFDHFKDFLEDIDFENFIKYSNATKLQIIKRDCKKRVKEIIKNDIKKLDTIFKGEHNFEDPYKAYWICENGILSENIHTDFSIDAGSGRKTIDIGR